MSQYFTLFDLPAQFVLDENNLQQRYHMLAARFHPDKFAACSTFEQKQAVMMTSAINQAYRVLSHPLDRAAYLLREIHQIDADAPEHTAFAPEFLMQQMEWREELDEARRDTAALNLLDKKITAAQTDLYNQLATAFTAREYETAAEYVRRGRFLNKLHQEIESAMP